MSDRRGAPGGRALSHQHRSAANLSRQALEALPRLIAASSDAQVGVMEIDWRRLGRASAKFRDSPIFGNSSGGNATQSHGATAGEWRAAVSSASGRKTAAVCELVVDNLRRPRHGPLARSTAASR